MPIAPVGLGDQMRYDGPTVVPPVTTDQTAPRDTFPRCHTDNSAESKWTAAIVCGLIVAVMLGMSFAAVPFYGWFCRATGLGGTTQVSKVMPGEVLSRKLIVRLDANLSGGLPWKFEPEQNSVEARIGEVVTVLFTVTNESPHETVGQAAYNVVPLTVGAYFEKVNCFCFAEQRLKAGERREMTVVFYVDPALAHDSEQDDLNTITLSYTMYPVRPPRDQAAADQRRANLDSPDLQTGSGQHGPAIAALVAR
jgi:cytochrome c oxidase assembly protein subunit 11